MNRCNVSSTSNKRGQKEKNDWLWVSMTLFLGLVGWLTRPQFFLVASELKNHWHNDNMKSSRVTGICSKLRNSSHDDLWKGELSEGTGNGEVPLDDYVWVGETSSGSDSQSPKERVGGGVCVLIRRRRKTVTVMTNSEKRLWYLGDMWEIKYETKRVWHTHLGHPKRKN